MPYGVRVTSPAPAEATKARPGPKPRFTRDRLTEAALAIVDRDGFDALSLRAVARELGVTPMALYTYVASSEDLATMVIDQLVQQKAPKLRVSRDWRQVLKSFASSLAELVTEHPALLQAYAKGPVATPAALHVAERVLAQLRDAGLSPRLATEAYAAVHSLVLGHALLEQAPRHSDDDATVDPQQSPMVAAALRAGRRPGQIPLSHLVTLVIDGIESRTR